MDFTIIRMSSKGQIVIPASMRKDISEGNQLIVIREGERLILTPLAAMEPAVREDIIFAEKTEKAFLEYTQGRVTTKSDLDFIDTLSSW